LRSKPVVSGGSVNTRSNLPPHRSTDPPSSLKQPRS